MMQSQKAKEIHNIIMQQNDGIDEIIQQNSQTLEKIHNQGQSEIFSKIKDDLDAFLECVRDDVLQKEEEINDYLNDNILTNLNNQDKRKVIQYLLSFKQDHKKLHFLYNILDQNSEEHQNKSHELNENKYYLDAREKKEYSNILNKLTNEKFILVNKIPSQIASSKDFLESILNTQLQKIHLLFDYNEYQQGLRQLTQIELIKLLTQFIENTEEKLQQIIGSISIRQCSQFQSYIDWIQEQEQKQFTTQQNQKFLNELLSLDLIKIQKDLIKFISKQIEKLNHTDPNPKNNQQGVLRIFEETLRRQICCNMSLDQIYFAITFYFWIKHHNKIVKFHQEISKQLSKVPDKLKENIFQTKLKQYQKENQEQDSIHNLLMNKIIFYKSYLQQKLEQKERNSNEQQVQNISNYFSRIFNQCFNMDQKMNDKIDQQSNFIHFLEQLQELHFYQIRFVENNQCLKHFIQILWINSQNDSIFDILKDIPNQQSELIIFLNKLQDLNTRMDNILYYLILDILELIIIKDATKFQNVNIFRDQFEDLQSFQCIEKCINLKTIILKNSLDNLDEGIKILQDIFDDLQCKNKEGSSKKQWNLQFLVTLGGKDYGNQFLLLYHCYKNNEIQSQIINIVIRIQFFKKNRNLDMFKQCCYNLFMLDEGIYDQCYEQFKDITDFQITPQFFQHKKIHQRYPNKINILIEQFNLSRTEQKTNNQIIKWASNLNNSEQFLSLLPFLFDIIKRGESIEPLLDQVNKNIGNENREFMNFKVIFQILYNNSDKQLQMLLLKNLSFNYPIPFVYQNPNVDNILVEEDLYLINPNIYFLLQKQYSIINFSFSKNQTQIGKTQLINKVFYRKDKFNIQDTNNLTRNTIDLMLDKEFNGSRNFLIADTHGCIPQNLLLKILPLFSFWIIQMDTEEELNENLENIKNLNNKFKIINHKILFIIRNSKSKQIDQSLQEELNNNNIQIQQIQNLSQKGINNQLIQQQIKQVQEQIFQQIVNHEEFKPFNQENFIQIVKTKDQEELKKLKILVQEIKDEAEKFFNQPKGFYHAEAFPLRYFDQKIKELQEKESQLFEDSQYCLTKEINQLQEVIITYQNYQKQQKPTKLLKLFKQLICLENYTSYINLIQVIYDLTRESTDKLQIQNQDLLDKLHLHQIENREDKEGFNQLKYDFEECEKELQSKSLNIDIFWREYIKQSFLINQCQEVADQFVKLLMKGETFELLDGEQLRMDIDFFELLVKSIEKISKNNKILVIGILGPQSSGKSTILNKIFGCHFFSSVGKSTKGIYFQMIEVKKNSMFENQFDFILILDTEGLQSPNQKDPLFDKRISLFIFAICDIILINVKGEINSQFKNLVEICIYSLAQIQNALSNTKQISWCFNQNIDTQNKSPFIDQLTQLTTQLFHDNGQFGKNKDKQQDILELIEIKKENIQILSTATTQETWNIEGSQQFWTQLIPNETYSRDAYKYGVKVIETYIEKCKKNKQGFRGQQLENFFLNSYNMWETISKLPDLLEFSELIQLQQNQLISNFYYQLWNENKLTFKSQIPTLIKQKIEQLNFDLNFKHLQEIQQELESKLSIDCEIMREIFEEKLKQFKEEKNIQKNIYQKFINKLQNEINNLQTECNFFINEQIKNQEINYQKSRGFGEINKYINSLSPEKRMKMQNDEIFMKEEFDKIWGDIKIKYLQQRKQKYDETQTASLRQIKSYFQEYQLTIENDNNFQNFIHDHINKFDQKEEEKDKIFQQYSFTLMKNQFTKMQKDDIYNLNFQNLSFDQKIEKSSGSFLSLDQQIQVKQYNIKYVSKTELQNYFENNFKEDLKNVEKMKNIQDLLKILDLFQVKYDQNKKERILLCYENKHKQGYLDSCCQFTQTLKFNDLDRQCQFSKEDSILFEKYLKSKVKCSKIKIQKTQITALRKDCIIISQEVDNNNIESKDFSNKYCCYIINPQKSNFVESFQVEFNSMLNNNKKWNHIYSEIYDKIKTQIWELPDNIEIISKDILSKVMQQISDFSENRYKPQFSLYGLQLSNMGERCIYYYCLHIIWRFYCLKIWKEFEENEKQVDNSKDDQWQSFRLEIHQHKFKLSQQKGKSLANYLIEQSQQIFYQVNRIEIEDFIKRELKQNENLVKKLDDILIIKRQKFELLNEMTDQEQLIKYLTNQLSFIQTYVEKYITHVKTIIQIKYQELFNLELKTIFNRVETNAKTLLKNLSNQPSIVSYFEKSIRSKFYEIKDQDQKKKQENLLEIKLFNLVFRYLLEYEQINKEIEEIDDQYQDCFIHYQERKQNILINQRNQMDNQIHEIQPFLQSFLDTLNLDRSIQFDQAQFVIQESLNSLKMAMIGCTHCCPMCNRKCDCEPDFLPHSCQNGHYLIGMKGILLGNKPSLQSCEEIKDDQIIDVRDTQKQMKWKEIKQQYQKWNFTSVNTKKIKENKSQLIKVWNNGIGNLICKQLSQTLNTNIDYNRKEKKKMFYIFILDDSFSMEGKKGDEMMESLRKSLKFLKSNKYAKVSVISFNYKASLQIEFKKPKAKLIKKIILVGGITNFDPPFKLCLDQIQKFQEKIEQAKVLFYSDGEGTYPQRSLDEYRTLSQELRNKISFLICTAGSKPQIQLKMVEQLTPVFKEVELRKNIQSEDLSKCWNEIIIQNLLNDHN